MMNSARVLHCGLLLGLSLQVGCQDRAASPKAEQRPATASAAPEAAGQGDSLKLQGVWKAGGFGYNNAADSLVKLFVNKSPCDWVVIQDAAFKCLSGFDDKKEQFAEATFMVDPSKTPKTIDLAF